MKKKKPATPKRTNPVAKNAHHAGRAQCLEPHKSYQRHPKHKGKPE